MARDKIVTVKGFKLEHLKQIVKEEVEALKEGVDHKAISSVVTGASKLLAAVESFKKDAPHAALGAVTPAIDQLAKVLEDMVSTPGSYVEKPKPVQKIVSLKPVKGK